MITTSTQASDNSSSHGESHGHGGSPVALAIGAIGVVFGDIGTSPLYAFRETFASHGGAPGISPDADHIHGVLSLVFWSMMMVVTVKYVLTIMRADNGGEGGSLALLALIKRNSSAKTWTGPLILLGVFATALFYGDSMITPAISVLSATEGLQYIVPGFKPWIVPTAVAILFGLFAIQSRGTDRVGRLFGPIMLTYFSMLAVLGVMHLSANPSIILETINPLNALGFFATDGFVAFVALGSVVLAVTGAEALYADMGHFGRKPIGISWLTFVYPALMLNYMGQGALILSQSSPAEAAALVKDPFFLMIPDLVRVPVIILALLATIIASQAVISGAFSLTQQAIQLGFIPRMEIRHTSASAAGQIYIPTINWGLMIMVILLVLFFQSSSALAAAYGIAVTGAMFIDTLLLSAVLFSLWRWPIWKALPLVIAFLIVDIAYFGANLIKVPSGGWVPLLIGFVIFTLLTTWSRGRELMRASMAEGSLPIEIFAKSAHNSSTRVPGTAVFMASSNSGVPSALLHNIKHNKVLHERVLILTVQVKGMPYVEDARRYECKDLGNGFYRVTIYCGFLEETDVPRLLGTLDLCGGAFEMMQTSFFLSRQTLIPSSKPGMAIWREKLFAWMLRNAASAMAFFRLPTNRVVELGSQVEI
ncbi:potassium transporter Kup [Erythrobacter neustonensis]|uniref:Probable potassium transport system protein Kup n=1 Tax=Erythrobacter neustonensis TaxID=1112 RepID=A0A192D4B1_9SPHN|nr:potassium transporter Kup [Erythrobacter neustonensis]ANK13318.1 potassium transporter Kup [Erythrobacter neustonensis]